MDASLPGGVHVLGLRRPRPFLMVLSSESSDLVLLRSFRKKDPPRVEEEFREGELGTDDSC